MATPTMTSLQRYRCVEKGIAPDRIVATKFVDNDRAKGA